MEPEGSLPHSQASATRPYPGLAQSSPHTHNQPPGDQHKGASPHFSQFVRQYLNHSQADGLVVAVQRIGGMEK